MATQSFKTCKELFAELPDKIALKFLRSAARKAATLIRDEMSRTAPRDEGDLSDNMTIKTKKEDDREIVVEIGPSKKEFYGRFVDKGTKFITARNFMMPAFDAKKDDAATVFAVELDKAILKHFNK